MTGGLEQRLADAGIRVAADRLRDRDVRSCLMFLTGADETIDNLVSCYGGEGGRDMAASGSVYDRASGSGGARSAVPPLAGKEEEDLGLLAQRLGLAVANGVMSQEEARELLWRRGVELGATPPPMPKTKTKEPGGGELGERPCPVEAALRDGRIGPESAGEWRRLAEKTPADVAQALALLPPSPERARAYLWSLPATRAAYAELAHHVGLASPDPKPDPDPERERLYTEFAAILGI